MARYPSLSSLRLFLLVARSGSFSEAARVANLSQPALSRTIKLLEEDLGVRLFDRNSRNVNLIAAGSTLVPTVERLTTDFELAFRELNQTFEGMRGRVVVGALPSAAAILLPQIVAEFRARRPQVDVIIRENLKEGLHQSLQDRLIDFVISTPPADSEDIDFSPLFEDECVLVCRPEEAAAIADPAPWSVFRDFPFIGMEPRSSVRVLTDAAFARADIVTPALYECSQLATVGGLISAGLGVSLLPRSTLPLLAAGGAVVGRPLRSPQVSRTIGISRLRGRTLVPAAEALLAALSTIHPTF